MIIRKILTTIKVTIASLFVILLSITTSPANANEVNLYTNRQAVFLRPVLTAFEEKTGIKVNVLFAKKGLLERVQAEGKQSPADVIMAVDSARLKDYVDANLLAKHGQDSLRTLMSTDLSSDYWLAITQRARIFYTQKGIIIKSYSDLAKPQYHQAICIRSGSNTYNIALIADLISRWGEDKTKQWLLKVKENLARTPQGKDRTQIIDVAKKKCKIGIANSYYYFQLLKNSEHRQRLIDNVDVIIPTKAHINITGAGVALYAPNHQNALSLLNFLLSEQGQNLYEQENGEFPVRSDIVFPSVLKPYQKTIKEAAPLSKIAKHRITASKLIEEVQFNR